MFGKPPQDPNPPQKPAGVPEMEFLSQTPKPPGNLPGNKSAVEAAEEKSELVRNVEKISHIISPYFIVLVGLLLSDDNFLIGTFLIAVGILSLLKVSWQDLTKFGAEIKKALGLGDPKS